MEMSGTWFNDSSRALNMGPAGDSGQFWTIFDDSATVTDDVPEIVHCASGNCCIEKRTSPTEW